MGIVSENFTLFENGTLCLDVRNASDSEIDHAMSVLVSEGEHRNYLRGMPERMGARDYS